MNTDEIYGKDSDKVIPSLFGDLGDHSFKVRSREAASSIAIFSSWILSIASGWTTYHGIINFLPVPFITLLITIGIQLLLLSSSIKVAQNLVVTKFDLKQIITLFASITASVFFSFQSFFSSIYSSELREIDRASDARSSYYIEYSYLQSLISANEDAQNSTSLVSSTKANTRATQRINSTFENILQELNSELINANNNQERFRLLKETEYEVGSPPMPEIGKNEETNGGDGPWFTYFRDLHESAEISSQALTGEIQLLRTLRNKLVREYPLSVDDDSELLNFEKLCFNETAKIKYDQLVSLCDTNDVKNAFSSLNKELERINTFRDICREIAFTNYTEFRDLALRCIADSPVEAREKSAVIARLSANLSSINPDQHQFVILTQELATFDLLAVLSLLIAILVDSLIFLCVLTGAKASSYLYLETKEDIHNVQNEAMELIFQVKEKDYTRYLGNENKLLQIVNLIEFCHLALLENRTPGVISLDTPEVKEMSEVFGPLMFHGQAILLDDNKASIMGDLPDGVEFSEQIRNAKYLGLKLSFILWSMDFLDRQVHALKFKQKYTTPVTNVILKFVKLRN